MSTSTLLTVAAVQPTPVFLDRQATVERLVALIKEAGAAGARLIALPEAIVPGYPDWVWRLPAWKDHDWYKRLHDQAVDIPGPTTDALGAAAAEASAWVAVGSTSGPGQGRCTTHCCTSAPTARLRACTESCCPPAVSAPCGAAVTAPPSPSSRASSVESAG